MQYFTWCSPILWVVTFPLFIISWLFPYIYPLFISIILSSCKYQPQALCVILLFPIIQVYSLVGGSVILLLAIWGICTFLFVTCILLLFIPYFFLVLFLPILFGCAFYFICPTPLLYRCCWIDPLVIGLWLNNFRPYTYYWCCFMKNCWKD